MATDIEESDTEDHERLPPPKRKCIKLINMTNDDAEISIHKSVEKNINGQNDTDSETLARETLLYQQYQIDKQCYMGSVDNTINRVMETYILTSPSERAQLRLVCEAEMEDRAVMMAIRNHGLVHSTSEIESNSCVTNNYWLNDDDYDDDDDDDDDDDVMNSGNSSNNSNELLSELNDSNSESATSSDIFTTKTFQNLTKDKADDGVQQQDILERAVAEAIKIKGLSALSVDYG